MENYDFVVYEKGTKEIVTIILSLEKDPQFLISEDYVGIYIPHKDYSVTTEKNGRCYFENLNEKVLWLDDFRGRYEE